jgi:putative ABC transport system ATP-binding protein
MIRTSLIFRNAIISGFLPPSTFRRNLAPAPPDPYPLRLAFPPAKHYKPIGSRPFLMTQPPLPAKEPVFVARGIGKLYAMGDVTVQALKNVDLDLLPEEFVVLLGPSGSGKSTLLNILGGLDVPTSGTVHYRDHDLTACDDTALTRYRREHVGFVFQFYNLVPSLTARENVALVTEIAENPMLPEEALDRVGLAHRMNHFPSELSGGEQQRVAIARSIAKRPDVLLCDEPTGALDVETGILVLDVIQRVNRELGTTTAVITHNAVIAGMADRVISMRDGTIVNEVRNARRLEAKELVW